MRIVATTQWDAETALAKCGGHNGLGHLGMIYNAFRKLSGTEQRPLCLWLDRAGSMRPSQQEAFSALCEWSAHHLGIKLRLIFLMQQTLKWDYGSKDRKPGYERDWLISAPLRQSAQEWSYSRGEGFEEAEIDAAPAVAVG